MSHPSPIALLQSVEAILDADYDNMSDDDGNEPLSCVDPSVSALWSCHSLGNSLNRVPPSLLPSLFATPSRTRAAASVDADVDMESNDADFILKVRAPGVCLCLSGWHSAPPFAHVSIWVSIR